MRKALALAAVVLTLGLTVAMDADAARRLGGGKSTGMQRQTTTAPAATPGAPNSATGAPAQSPSVAGAPAAAGGAAAAAGKRSWMGPIAGLAAGLGLAALASHFGFGEALANMMMIGLLVMAALALVGFIMRKRMANQAGALAGAAGGGGMLREPVQQEPARPQSGGGSLIGSRLDTGAPSAAAAAGTVGTIPADFDQAAFVRNAKDQFMALQAANDARDLDRLRDFLTPEMFELVKADLAARGEAPQRTEVFGLQAQVLDVAQEDARYVVSVRFTGSVRDEPGATPEDLDETWHLVKPRTGFGGWLIAGIQQAA